MISHARHEIPIEDLESMIVAFLDFSESLDRALLPSERHAFHWLQVAFDDRTIRSKHALRSMPDEKIAYYLGLSVRLREVLAPDPAKRIRFKRVKPEAVAELHSGNYQLRLRELQGVSPARMTIEEALERVYQLERLAIDAELLCRELSLVRQRDKDEAAAVSRAAKKLASRVWSFARRCKQQPEIPPEPSIDEVLVNMEIMRDIMTTECPVEDPEECDGAA